jgi:hypothetical protein
MSTVGLSTVLSNSSHASQAVTIATIAPVAPAATVKSTSTLEPDTVKLSPAAQAKLLHREGLSVSRIATSLGTNVSAIDKYLNIAVPKPVVDTVTATASKSAAPASTGAADEANASQPSVAPTPKGSTPAAPGAATNIRK